MDRGSDTAGRHVDFARIGFGISDELGNGLGRNRWVDLHDERHADDARDWRDVAHEIEFEVFVERHVYRVGRSDLQKCVAVRRRPQGRLSSDIAGSTRPVVDYEFLTETLRQPLRHDASNNVGRPAGGKPNDDTHGTDRIGLRPRTRRYGGGDDGTRHKQKKKPTEPPPAPRPPWAESRATTSIPPPR